MISDKVLDNLPHEIRRRVEPYVEAVQLMTATNNAKVLKSMAPSGIRGLILQRGKQGVPTTMPSNHRVYFDWTYPNDQPEMRDLYQRAKEQQWNGDDLPWHIDVDPENAERAILPDQFMDFEGLRSAGIRLNEREQRRLRADNASWILSQFLHGEQGALFAAAQVTEAVQFFDGKLYGATQVVDEGRHVEVFHRYLDTKLNKLYQINDNLFVIIDALIQEEILKFTSLDDVEDPLEMGAKPLSPDEISVRQGGSYLVTERHEEPVVEDRKGILRTANDQQGAPHLVSQEYRKRGDIWMRFAGQDVGPTAHDLGLPRRHHASNGLASRTGGTRLLPRRAHAHPSNHRARREKVHGASSHTGERQRTGQQRTHDLVFVPPALQVR